MTVARWILCKLGVHKPGDDFYRTCECGHWKADND